MELATRVRRWIRGVFVAGSLLAGLLATPATAGWSVSGTVKNAAGASISGVGIAVKDSAAYGATTSATGAFSLSSKSGIGRFEWSSDSRVRMETNELVVSGLVDGSVHLRLTDGAGRKLWSAHVQAKDGQARIQVPQGLRSQAVFLRIEHQGGGHDVRVIVGPQGWKVASHLSGMRAMAVELPTLIFKKSGYKDKEFTPTSATVSGVVVTMDTNTTCPLPTSFKWKDAGAPIASPKNGWLAIKDFSMVHFENQYYVYMTYTPVGGGFQSAAMAPFSEFSKAKDAAQMVTNTGVAPELIYFTPKKTWVMSKQWCAGASFCYMTSPTPSPSSSFVQKGNLLTETITDGAKAPIDQVVICDDKNCYLFYADDNGRIYRGSMPIGNFPGVFTGTKKILEESNPARLFEAVEVYRIKGQQLYLMIVECGYPRYFRAFTATDLGGTWTPLANATTQAVPFAGKNNVAGAWSDDISHGDIVREGYDETRTIDPCNLQMIYQGQLRNNGVTDYSKLPYQMGLITLQR